MKGRLIIVGFFALIAGLALAFPDRLLNPGPLMQGHAQTEKKCLSCHQPFRGAVTMQCTSCHKPDDIGVKSVKGVVLAGKQTNVLFHRGLPANSCLDCHTDHKGRNAKKALRTFRHESIVPGISAACITCHDGQRPKDNSHASFGTNCSACHNTRNWKPATFNHKTIATAKRCIDCHKGDLPANRLHASAGTNCATCHTTRAWKPATFNHSRYFRLDGDHRASCATCHDDPGDFRKYTCYGCHEHTPSKIAREHLEEGIRNYGNCARCHRTGTDHD